MKRSRERIKRPRNRRTNGLRRIHSGGGVASSCWVGPEHICYSAPVDSKHSQHLCVCVCVIKSELAPTIIYSTHLDEAGGWGRDKGMLPPSRGKRWRRTSAFKAAFCLLAVWVGPVPHLSNHFGWNNSQLFAAFSFRLNTLSVDYAIMGRYSAVPIWNADDPKQGSS